MMIKTNFLSLSILATAAIALVGCSSQPKLSRPARVTARSIIRSPGNTTVKQGQQTRQFGNGSGTNGTGLNSSGTAVGGTGSGVGANPSGTGYTVYFDFDSSAIKPEYDSLITTHASYLHSHPGAHVTLEGNTDERGSREYNLALGQRRAEAVQQSLTLQGASSSQIESVSFGAERPADPGHDEEAYAKNRRSDFRYR